MRPRGKRSLPAPPPPSPLPAFLLLPPFPLLLLLSLSPRGAEEQGGRSRSRAAMRTSMDCTRSRTASAMHREAAERREAARRVAANTRVDAGTCGGRAEEEEEEEELPLGVAGMPPEKGVGGSEGPAAVDDGGLSSSVGGRRALVCVAYCGCRVGCECRQVRRAGRCRRPQQMMASVMSPLLVLHDA